MAEAKSIVDAEVEDKFKKQFNASIDGPVGLLIYSGLSSLLHIAGLLSGMMPKYIIKGE